MAGILTLKATARAPWPETRWSIVGDLVRRDESSWQTSWSYLLDLYREPMESLARRLLVRSGGRAAGADAADVLQEFLVKCVEGDWLSKANPERGRFRTYVRMLLDRFVKTHVRNARARKRRPPGEAVVLPLLDLDPADVQAPPDALAEDQEFDRHWFKVALDAALEKLSEDKPRYHLIVSDLLRTDGEGSPNLAALAGALKRQLPVLKNRARRRLSDLLTLELEATVRSEEDLLQEVRAVQAYLPDSPLGMPGQPP